MVMRKKPSKVRRTNGTPAAVGGGPVGPDNGGVDGGIETTGRFVVIFKDELVADPKRAAAALGNVAGVKNVASSADFKEGAVSGKDLAGGEAVHFRRMGMAIVSDEDAVQALAAAAAADGDSPIMAIEPEYYAHPTASAA